MFGVESGSPISARRRQIVVRFVLKGLFERLKVLTNLLDLLEKLDHLLALTEPGTKLGRRSQFGLDSQRTDQGIPFAVDACAGARRARGLRSASVCARGSMPIELG